MCVCACVRVCVRVSWMVCVCVCNCKHVCMYTCMCQMQNDCQIRRNQKGICKHDKCMFKNKMALSLTGTHTHTLQTTRNHSHTHTNTHTHTHTKLTTESTEIKTALVPPPRIKDSPFSPVEGGPPQQGKWHPENFWAVQTRCSVAILMSPPPRNPACWGP